MSNWHCDSRCKVSRGGAGPRDDKIEYFSNIKLAHKDCPGFQIGEPGPKGKSNWGNTDIEKEFTQFFRENIDEIYHNLISFYKQNKSCLIRGHTI